MRNSPILFLLLLTFVAIGAVYAVGVHFQIPLDEAIRRDLRAHATTADINARIDNALAKDDVETADMYAQVAHFMDRPIAPSVQQKLADAHSTMATVTRDAKDFGKGFVMGEGTSSYGLAGTLVSDFTVVGDVRDIGIEGQKMVRGQDYSKLILGLSVVGLAATVATVATGGGGVFAKAGVSALKAAKRAGTLTAEFARRLTHLLEDAVKFPELRRVAAATDLTDIRATERSFGEYAKTVKFERLAPVFRDVRTIGENAGPSETVRLMRYVHSEDELDDVAKMSGRMGKKTRGIIAITGKTALRAFKTSLNVFEFLVHNIIAFGAWLLGLLGLGATRQVVRAGWRRATA